VRAAKTVTLASEPGKQYILTKQNINFQSGIDFCDSTYNGATMVRRCWVQGAGCRAVHALGTPCAAPARVCAATLTSHHAPLPPHPCHLGPATSTQPLSPPPTRRQVINPDAQPKEDLRVEANSFYGGRVSIWLSYQIEVGG
jgi:hypothetical protein